MGKRGGKRVGTRVESGWRTAFLLTLLALVHRWFFFHSNEDAAWAFSVFYEGDAEVFHNYARAIRSGQPYDGGVPFHPPGFPYFLSAIHALTGAGAAAAQVNHEAVRLVLAVVSSLTVGATYLVSRPFVGRAAALVGSLLLAYSFGHYMVSVNPTSEGLAMLLTVIAVGLWTRLVPGWRSEDPAPAWAAPLFGVVCGLLILTRAEAALLLGLLVAFGAWRTRSGGRRAWVSWGLAVVGVLVVVTPWTTRNHSRLTDINRQLGPQLAEPLATFVPVTVYGPLNLALANHDGADGSFSRDLLADPTGGSQLDLKNPEHLRAFNHGDDMAWGWIRANPGSFLSLVAKKWRLTGDALALGWTQWNLPGGHRGFRRPVDLFVTNAPWGFLLTLPLLVIGVVFLARGGPGERRWLGVTALVTGATAIVVGLFFGYARFGVMLFPFLYGVMGVGLSRLLRVESWASHPRLKWAPWAIVGTLLIVEGWGATGSRAFDARGSSLAGASHLNPHATIYLEPK